MTPAQAHNSTVETKDVKNRRCQEGSILPFKRTASHRGDSDKMNRVKEFIQDLGENTTSEDENTSNMEDKFKTVKEKLIKGIEMLKRTEQKLCKRKNQSAKQETQQSRDQQTRLNGRVAASGEDKGETVAGIRHTQRKECIDQNFRNSEIHSTDQSQESMG